MAGVALTLTFDDEALTARLGTLREALADFSPAMDEIGALLEDRALERFETGVAPDGTAWKPSQRALDTGGKTLVDTGRLLASIAYEASADEVSVGTNAVYAAIHQFGGKAGRGLAADMPARPFLGVSGDDEAEIELILLDFAGGGT